jgi:hypothetical protein
MWRRTRTNARPVAGTTTAAGGDRDQAEAMPAPEARRTTTSTIAAIAVLAVLCPERKP